MNSVVSHAARTSLKPGGIRYGLFTLPGRKKVGAHRVALMLTQGPPPPGLECAHSCDNPICCNPGHLSWQTHKQNVHDYQRKYGVGGDKTHRGLRLRIR